MQIQIKSPNVIKLKFSKICVQLIIIAILPLAFPIAQAAILFQNDDFATIYSDNLLINSDDGAAGNISIQFGQSIAQTLTWNAANSRFDLSSSLNLNNNEIIAFRTENATAFPGGGAGLGGGGTGRLIMLTTIDSVAPGCTPTACDPGIYVWDGAEWVALTSSAGAGAPGGDANDVQYNDGNSIEGESAFDYDETTNQLTAPGTNITEDLALTGDISPAQITADQNDYNPTGLATASVIRLSGDSSFRTITGLAGGADGRVVMLHNISSNSILLANQNTASTAANRFDLGGMNLPLLGGNLITLQYDSTSSRWRLKNNKAYALPLVRRGVYHIHDMLGLTTDSAISSQVATGSNSATAVTSEIAHPGIVRHSTGGAAGRAGMLSTDVAGILLGNSWTWHFDGMVRITTLSTAAQTYVYRIGFIDSATGEPVDGVYFRYTHGTNSGQWQLVCRSNNTETATNSTSAPAIATWYRLTIAVNPAGTSAEFFVNGTSIGTCASNLPTGAGRGTGFGSNIIKTNGNTARTIDLDYLEIASYANTINQ